MKVSLNWVKEFTDVKLPVDKLVEKIGAQLGAVEEVIDLGKKYQNIVIAKVMKCEPHPNADKLKVCKIDDGSVVKDIKRDAEGFVGVVCGAPNVKEGMLVVWLPPGRVVPATYDKDPLKLEAREIRGVVSNGMLASAHELAISDDHTGLVEISPNDAKPGNDFAKIYGLDDYIIDIENKMFTHRPDLFGILGVAREIAGITGQRFKTTILDAPVDKYAQPSSQGGDFKLQVSNELPGLVPRFTAQVINDVQIRPSSLKDQARLSRLGIRPINNVVDVTNLTMHLTGQPMHAYDYDKVRALDKGAKHASIVIRYPRKSEKLTLLGGKVIEPNAKAILIASATRAIGMGGIMGGADTEVDENTKNIILEVANFDMYSIRRTAMEHGLFTDAVTRFTKGQSPLQVDRVLALAVNSIVGEGPGGIPAGKAHDLHGKLPELTTVKVSPSFINERLGLSLTAKKIIELLENVEFRVIDIRGGQLAITPPFWRTDIEIPEDIVEEVGRLYGYDRLPLELPKRDLTPPNKDVTLELKSKIRSNLSAAGANEVLNYSFVHGKLLENTNQDKKQAFQIANALSPDLQYYRMSLTPSLLDKIHPNVKAGYGKFALFEIGKAHHKSEFDEENFPAELDRIALIFTAETKSAAAEFMGTAFYEAYNYAKNLLESLGIGLFQLVAGLQTGNSKLEAWGAPYETTRSVMILAPSLQDHPSALIGLIGEFKQDVKKAFKLPGYTAGFEMDISVLETLQAQTGPSGYVSLPRFPKVEQDISLKVPTALRYGELFEFISQCIDEIRPDHTKVSLEPLDIYQREDDKEHKQITLRLSIASYKRTMTDKEINALLDKVALGAHEKFSAERI